MTYMTKGFRRTRFACFYTYLAMSSVFCLPPLLFATFRDMYGISYTLLGTLVVTCFCTQLLVDLLMSVLSKRMDTRKLVRIMPLLTSAGLCIYAIVPTLFPEYAYAGFLVGTVIFSIAAGLCEVLLSPLVALLPSDNTQRDLSALHSLYAYGVLLVVLVSTVYLRLFGTQNWMYLTLFWAILPVISSVLFFVSPLPDMQPPADVPAGEKAKKRTAGLALCVAFIFLGSAAENTMTNWISTYMEDALLIPKAVGDILGIAMFSVLLGLTRTWYAKYGKNIFRVLLVGVLGAICCYLTVGFCSNVAISMVACALTGVFTSMLWPGTLILMEEKIPNPGVAAYALMAAGGDFGASVAPQLMGVVVDTVSVTPWATQLAAGIGAPVEQIGMKVGMVISAGFPVLGVIVLLLIRRYFKKQ